MEIERSWVDDRRSATHEQDEGLQDPPKNRGSLALGWVRGVLGTSAMLDSIQPAVPYFFSRFWQTRSFFPPDPAVRARSGCDMDL